MAINKLGTENLAGILSGKSSNPQEIEEKTDNYTLAFTDKDRLVTMSSGTNRTITIPADATTAFLDGTQIDIANIGTGALTIAGASGVTLNGIPTILAQNQSAQITKLGDNNWIVRGYSSFDSPDFTGTVDLPATTNYDGEQLSTTFDSKADKSAGYQYHSTVYFTSNGTFTKASYPWLRAIRVKVQGAGGGAGYAAATGAGQGSSGGGGGGGTYSESFITDIPSLSSSVSVVVGAGGSGGIVATSTSAINGGESSFGDGQSYEVSSPGGQAGNEDLRSGPSAAAGGVGGAAGTGDFVIHGSGGQASFTGDPTVNFYTGVGGQGGASLLGLPGRSNRVVQSAGLSSGYGSGGSGACEAQSRSGVDGRDGRDGIVIVELYA